MRRELSGMAGTGLAVGLLAAILIVGWIGYGLIFGGNSASHFVLTDVRGGVHHVDGLGADHAAAVGQVLDTRDRLVAEEGGSAVLSFGEADRITLDGGASIRVLASDGDGLRVELEGGKVQATVRPGGGSLGVVADGREFVADNADFTAVRAGDGTTGVEVSRGDVGVKGAEGVKQVREGERLIAAKGGAPLVAPASESLLLYVNPPGEPRTKAAAIVVTGRTQPGAIVAVENGKDVKEVHADASGTFSASVALGEGSNDLKVEAHDVFGRRTVSDLKVVRDTLPPAVGVEIRY